MVGEGTESSNQVDFKCVLFRVFTVVRCSSDLLPKALVAFDCKGAPLQRSVSITERPLKKVATEEAGIPAVKVSPRSYRDC